MKITKQDNKLFENLNNTEIGRQLADYMERLNIHLCDCRNWKDDTDANAMKNTAKLIDEFVISRIRLKNSKAKVEDFE